MLPKVAIALVMILFLIVGVLPVAAIGLPDHLATLTPPD